MKNSIRKNRTLLNRLCYQVTILSLLVIISIPSKVLAIAEHDELITRVKQGNDHQIQKILKNVEKKSFSTKQMIVLRGLSRLHNLNYIFFKVNM